MNILPLSEVAVPKNRQRTTFDTRKFEELKSSIRTQGLFHAIILTEGNELVAGATRLRAIQEIYSESSDPIMYDSKEVPFGHIPFTFTHKTDPASIFRIELEENLRREQLSPLDEATALANLHHLLEASATELVVGTGLREKVTFQDTAKVLGEITGEPKTNDAQRIADSILVESMKDHPDVKRAKSWGEAVRAARKGVERQFREVLGGMRVDGGESRHRVLEGDCATRLAEVPDGSVDCIIADPPYGIGADSFGEQSLVGHEYKDDAAAFHQVITALMGHGNRICKPDAAMFIFMDIGVWPHLEQYYGEQFFPGWYIWPTPLIWYKPNRGHAPQPKRGPSRRYETILYAIRGNREVRKTGSDVLSFNVPDDRSHGAGKPVGLYSELLSWICYPGDVVLDPCAGSGTIVEAADGLDLTAVAIERDPAFVTMIREKMEKKDDIS